MLETDIGGSFIIIITALSVLAASGIKKRTFLKISGLISVGLIFAALILYFQMGINYDRQVGKDGYCHS